MATGKLLGQPVRMLGVEGGGVGWGTLPASKGHEVPILLDAS